MQDESGAGTRALVRLHRPRSSVEWVLEGKRILVTDMCSVLENTPSSHTTPSFFFQVWLVVIFTRPVLPLQDAGTARPLLLLLLSELRDLPASLPRQMVVCFQAQLKNASACSHLHMCVVFLLESIRSAADSEKRHHIKMQWLINLQVK